MPGTDNPQPNEQQQLLTSPKPPPGGSGGGRVKRKKRDHAPSKTEKAAAVRVKAGRAKAKIEIADCKLKCLDERRQALSMVSVFALLTVHKMDCRLIDDPRVNPRPIREALLILFIHHALNYCAEQHKLLSGQTTTTKSSNWKDDDLDPSIKIPTLIDASPAHSKGTELHSSAPSSDTHHRPGISPITKRKSPSVKTPSKTKAVKTEQLFEKEILHWLRRTVKMFALSVSYAEDDRDLQRSLRSLEGHLNFLAASPPTSPKLSGTSKHLVTKYHPLYFNPQPLKRQLLTHARHVHDELYRRILIDFDFIVKDDQTPGNLMPPVPAPRLLSRLTRSTTSAGGAEKGGLPTLLNPNVTPEDLVTVSKAVDSVQIVCSESVVDLAERVTHLPSTLSRALLNAGKPTSLLPMKPVETCTALTNANDLLTADITVPENETISGWRADSDVAPASSSHGKGTEFADDSSSAVSSGVRPESLSSDEGSDLFEGITGDSEPAGDTIETLPLPPPLEHEAHSARMVREIDSDSDEPLPEPLSAPSIVPSSKVEADVARDILDVFPLHILLLSEILFTLLSTGQWDTGFEQVLSEFACSLDVRPRIYQTLVAYTADIVAQAADPRSSGSKPMSGQQDDSDRPGSRDELPPTSRPSGLSIVSPNLLRPSTNQKIKALKIVGMAVGVGALSALTAGLAAPAFAAGFGALGIAGTSGLATFLGSAGGAASLASLFGASSASLSGWKYSRRLADIRVFEFVSLNGDIPNHITDAIAAYVEDVMLWFTHDSNLDQSQKTFASRLSRSFSGNLMRQPSILTRRRLLGVSHIINRQHTRLSGAEQQPAFNICIGISGWLKTVADATEPWNCLRDWVGSESFALKWEPQLLTELGTMLVRLVGETVAYQAASVGMQITMAASASFILWPVSILQYAGQIDNTWMVCRQRAQQAGALLAAALCDKSIVGNRPVTLVGYSMGSRVVAYCLRELYNKGEYHRVRNAVVMGLPGSRTKDDWRRMRSVVSGRLINVYCTTDWILAFLYRWMEWGLQVAGLGPIEGVPGVENFDASNVVFSHDNYEKRISDILTMVGLHASVFTRKNPPPVKPANGQQTANSRVKKSHSDSS